MKSSLAVVSCRVSQEGVSARAGGVGKENNGGGAGSAGRLVATAAPPLLCLALAAAAGKKSLCRSAIRESRLL